MGPLQRNPGTAPTAFSQDLPWLRRRERISLVKNRMREICTSGSGRDGDGNAPIYSALGFSGGAEVAQEDAAVAERRQGTKEAQFFGVECPLQIFQEQSTEEAGQHQDRQEEIGSAGDPSGAVGREPAAGNDTMQVRMMEQHLSPGMEHGKKPEFGAEVLGI